MRLRAYRLNGESGLIAPLLYKHTSFLYDLEHVEDNIEMTFFRLALAQINPTVGDLSGNADKIIRFVKQAKKTGRTLWYFPSLRSRDIRQRT